MKLHIASRHPNHQSFILALLAGMLLLSCSSTGPATKITGSWKDPEATAYKDYFVAALTKNLQARSTFERDISEKLKHEGVKATESLDVFAHTDKLETKEEKMAAVEKIKGLGHEAIITLVLLKKTEEQRYVPGENTVAPTNIGVGSGYYNPATGGAPANGTPTGFGGYYIDATTNYMTPGYYETDKDYFISCNIYDAKTSKLVWSVQSETFNPGSLASASAGFSMVMVDAMKKSGILGKTSSR